MAGARRRWGRRVSLLVIVLGLSLPLAAVRADAADLPGLRIAGARLLNAQGYPVALRGVNRSGTEYACMQGFGIFDGPSDDASVSAIASWRINFVRLLLNED